MASEEDSSEVSLCSAYCVVYVLEEQEWKVTGKGWAQVHVYRDQTDGTHRIVGWTVVGFEVLINANLTAGCKYKKKSEDFHKFVDQDDNTFGFGFYKQKEVSYEDSQKFLQVIVDTLVSLGAGEEESKKESKKLEAPTPSPTNNPSMAGMETGKKSGLKSTPLNKALGMMKIHASKKNLGGDSGISAPTNVKHAHHVAYNAGSRSYEGLPQTWAPQLKKQFGLEPTKVESVDAGYVSRIPAVLIQMRDYLRKHDAFEIVGVFRIAADADECVYVKRALDDNSFKDCDDIHCIVNLVKVWFRDMPRALLDPIDPTAIETCASEEDASLIIEMLCEPNKSIFLWLVDLCVEVQSFSHINKMPGKNLAIVISPNLFKPSMADPLACLRFSQKVALFFDKSIGWRDKQKIPPK